ncbi:MAG TPA: ABC transporter ATP-binding protein [Stellaceae bacterium]|nr:ABC transporter ATP-binding protein [Stellaceae bacterium]
MGVLQREATIPDSFVSVRGLVYEYDTRRAIDGVSFDIASGMVTALVGPNGAGKTTLLRCLAGLEQPVAGAIVVAGLDVLETPRAAHRKLGFLQDFFGVYDTLSVERNLLYAAAAQGMGRDELADAVTRAAESVGLADRMVQRAGELSRGLRQRLAIARSIVHRPPLLLLDEPAAGLDPEARSELSGLIRRLAGDGMTIVVSSHILAELEEYSTHMLAMRNGRLTGPRAIGESAAGRRRVRVGLLGADEPAKVFLATQAGIGDIRVEPGGLSFDLAGGPAAQHAVLRAMIEAGIEIAEFAPTGPDLQQMYLAEAAS